MTKRDTSWGNTLKGFGRIVTSKTFWLNVAILAVVIGAVTLFTGCAGQSQWDGEIDAECARLLRGDALDRASARRLGC
jgi:hypothetical protein